MPTGTQQPPRPAELAVWPGSHPRSPGSMVGPDVAPARVRALAVDLRAAGWALRVVADTVAGAEARMVAGRAWQGEAAQAQTSWAARFVAGCDGAGVALADAATALEGHADHAERAALSVRALQAEVEQASALGLGLAVLDVWSRYERLLSVSRQAEEITAGRLVSAAAALGHLGWARPTVFGLTAQQWRDTGRGAGDAAWEAGPGFAVWALKWLTVPGLLGVYDESADAEQATRARLDETGGGRGDTLTYDWAYGSATVAAIALPIPSGKGRAVSAAATAGERAAGVSRGVDEAGAVGAAVSPAGRAALRDYTGEGFWELNAALRSGRVVPGSDVARRVDGVSGALAELPAYHGMAYRGADLPSRRLAQYVEGAIVEEDAFTSATRIKDREFPGAVRFEIHSTSGRDIADHAVIREEAEVLFDHHTSFRVLSRSEDSDDTVVIVLEDLGR